MEKRHFQSTEAQVLAVPVHIQYCLYTDEHVSEWKFTRLHEIYKLSLPIIISSTLPEKFS